MSIPREAAFENFRATNAYRWYVLSVLILVGALAWIDRQVMSIVLQSIKVEFNLSDTQLGLLGGTAFGLFYVTVGLPIAWLADRFRRSTIIAGSIGLWSALTALCGLATGYWSLFAARVGVGIGEAGAAAPSQSMLSDYFPPERRGLAMGVLYSYIPISYLVSYGLGGWVNDTLGWRMAFIVFGLPGLVAALLLRLTVREPPRGYSEGAVARARSESGPRFSVALRHILTVRTMRWLPFAGAAHAVGMVGISVWMPAYLIRVHHMSATDVGIDLALILGVAGFAGALAGGHIADRQIRKTGDARWNLWICAIVTLLAAPFILCVFLMDDTRLALLLFVIPSVLNNMLLGPVFATVQNLGGVRHRAIAAAWYLFVVNLIAMGIGPALIGMLSDLTNARYGADALRYAMFLVPVASTLAGVLFLVSARTLREDLRRA